MFSASVDSFKNSIIVSDLKKASFWTDELYRTICDSDTYYAYQIINAYSKLTDTPSEAELTQNLIQSVINRFSERTDSFSLRILSVAYCTWGVFMYMVDTKQAIAHYDMARMYSSRIGDEAFAAYTVLLSSEAYEKDNLHVESAVLSRRILDSKIGQTVPMLRFIALLQLYKVYTQMRAYSMIETYGNIIENEGFYLTNLNYEVMYLFLKANSYIYVEKFYDAQECSQRLLQIAELVGNAPQVWCIYLQAAKIYCYLDEYAEAKGYDEFLKALEKMSKENPGCIKVTDLSATSNNGFFLLTASIDFYGTVLTNRVSVDDSKAAYTYWSGHTNVDTSGGFIGFPYVVNNEKSLWNGFVLDTFEAKGERPFAAYWANAVFATKTDGAGNLAKLFNVKDPRVIEITKKTKKGKATPTPVPSLVKVG